VRRSRCRPLPLVCFVLFRPPAISTLFPYTTLFRSSLVVTALAVNRGLIRLNLVQSSHLLISSLSFQLVEDKCAEVRLRVGRLRLSVPLVTVISPDIASGVHELLDLLRVLGKLFLGLALQKTGEFQGILAGNIR